MEETESQNTQSSNGSFLQIALATVAIALGGAALFLAINAAKKAGAVADDLTDKIGKIAAADMEVKKISDRIDSLALQIESIKSGGNTRLDSFARQVQGAMENMSSAVKSNRELIEANQKAIQELASRGGSSKAAAASAPATSSETAPAEAAAGATSAAGGKTYAIKSGDTLSKVAKQHKVSLDALQKANPNVDSSRLRVGQEIIIP